MILRLLAALSNIGNRSPRTPRLQRIAYVFVVCSVLFLAARCDFGCLVIHADDGGKSIQLSRVASLRARKFGVGEPGSRGVNLSPLMRGVFPLARS